MYYRGFGWIDDKNKVLGKNVEVVEIFYELNPEIGFGIQLILMSNLTQFEEMKILMKYELIQEKYSQKLLLICSLTMLEWKIVTKC